MNIILKQYEFLMKKYKLENNIKIMHEYAWFMHENSYTEKMFSDMKLV